MRQAVLQPSDSIGPLDWFRRLPFEADASSERMGWVGLQGARYRAVPASELSPPAMSHHRLALFVRPPDELDMKYDGVRRHVPPPAGAVSLVPAGSPARVRSSGRRDQLHIFLEPGLVERVAAEAFGLDPARLTVPPLDGLDLPELRGEVSGAEVRDSGHLLKSRAALEMFLDVFQNGAELRAR